MSPESATVILVKKRQGNLIPFPETDTTGSEEPTETVLSPATQQLLDSLYPQARGLTSRERFALYLTMTALPLGVAIERILTSGGDIDRLATGAIITVGGITMLALVRNAPKR